MKKVNNRRQVPPADLERQNFVPVVSVCTALVLTRLYCVCTEQAKGIVESKTAVSGPEYYGLAYPEVRRLIQDLPGARQCATQPMGQGCYKWQHFGDGAMESNIKVYSYPGTATAYATTCLRDARYSHSICCDLPVQCPVLTPVAAYARARGCAVLREGVVLQCGTERGCGTTV
eukprot:3940323-Rhodomonas_salina.1